MAETIRALRKEIDSWLQKATLGYLATVEDIQPRVRPVAIRWEDDCIWIGSGTENGKTRQVWGHPGVEICVPIERGDRKGYVRLSGTGEIVTDDETREQIGLALPFFDDFWSGPDDPSYSLICIEPDEIMYLRPEEDHHRTIFL